MFSLRELSVYLFPVYHACSSVRVCDRCSRSELLRIERIEKLSSPFFCWNCYPLHDLYWDLHYIDMVMGK